MMMGRRREAARRLLQAYQVVMADPPSSAPNKLGNSNSIQNHLQQQQQQQQQQSFDSSMGLTILVLLTALFFMGFFSIYIRRFAHDSPVDISRRRSLRTSSPSPSSYGLGNNARFCTRKGLDIAAIQTLPVLTYTSFGKHPIVVVDCPVCLTEFEEGECVKMLPSCRHLFHPECIDTWLLSRTSCPVCRASSLFAAAKRDELMGGEATEPGVGGDGAVAEDGMRRCCSCSNLAVSERGGLRRTRSF